MEVVNKKMKPITKRIFAFSLMLMMAFSTVVLAPPVTAEAAQGYSYTQVKTAANALEKAGIIDTASYWYNNYTKVDYLGDLIVKMANSWYQTGSRNITDVNKAIDKLAEYGVINTPSYWKANYKNIEYLDLLLIKTANRISGSPYE